MPAQTSNASTVYYVEFDTAPKLRACLKDGQGDPIDLSGSTVTITVAFAMPRGTYYTSPRRQIIIRSEVVIVTPQTGDNIGFVEWTPEPQDSEKEGILSPPGEFLYTFEVTYGDGGKQTIPANTYQTMIIKSPVGGRSLNLP